MRDFLIFKRKHVCLFYLLNAGVMNNYHAGQLLLELLAFMKSNQGEWSPINLILSINAGFHLVKVYDTFCKWKLEATFFNKKKLNHEGFVIFKIKCGCALSKKERKIN